LLSGWLDLSIGEMVETSPEFISRFPNVLITALDSDKNVGQTRIGREIMHEHPACREVDGAVLVPGPLVAELHRGFDLFVGFDAIWCFDAPPERGKPANVSIAPPPGFADEGATTMVQQWMAGTRCMLALADGFGMNYVTPDARIAAVLREQRVG
jgi:hypothetical protein